MKIKLPLTDAIVEDLRIGDVVELSGAILTARDAAHKRIVDAIEGGLCLPVALSGETIYYTGPTPPPTGKVVGSFGPTTSSRMDPYVEKLMSEGVKGMIGKGDRSAEIPSVLKRYHGVYFLAMGGAGALYSRTVQSIEVIAYHDLGTESIKRICLDNFKVIVGIDCHGNVLQDREIAKYRTL